MFFPAVGFQLLHVQFEQDVFPVKIRWQLTMVTNDHGLLAIYKRKRQLGRSRFAGFVLNNRVETQEYRITVFLCLAKNCTKPFDETGISMFSLCFCGRVVSIGNRTTSSSYDIAMTDVFLIDFLSPFGRQIHEKIKPQALQIFSLQVKL